MDTGTWSVHVVRGETAIEIGHVKESTESRARSAALARFGVGPYELEITGVRSRGAAIYPDEQFKVSPEV